MKTLLTFLLPAFIFTNFFTLNYSKELESNSSYFLQLEGDSSQTEELLGEPKKGLDGMFNERGFYSSNSFSYDENEIINDFNGNLQYTIPLHHIKGAGDMNIDVAVNYNGSMSYLAYTDSRYNVLQGDIPPQQNITAPGWIISVNGMAVQTLNFETHLITEKLSGNEVSDGNIKLLTNGYHVTRINQVQSGEKDKIFLLQGDGSIITLENLEANKYDGYYYSTNKKNYARAKVVKFNDLHLLENQEFYRKRLVYLTKGDGLTYLYREEYDNYNDYRFEYDIRIMKPRSFYLVRVEDRFGNYINIDYGFYSYPHYGKQIVQEITASWDHTGASNINFQYNTLNDNGKISVRNSVKGLYQINTSGFTFNPAESNYHQARVNSVVNPLNQQMTINYQTYERTYENLKYHSLQMPEIHFSFTDQNDLFCRISNFTNYNGGVRHYYYKGSTDMNIDMIWQEGIHYAKGTPDGAFRGQGRDPFYTNMVDYVEYKTSSAANTYRKISYSYGYTDTDDDDEWNPVDPEDLFSTTKNIERMSGAPVDNITSSGFSQMFHYKNYEIYDGSINPFVSDFPGEIVLFKTEEKSGVELVKTTDYFAQIGTSFLDTMVQVTYPNGGGTFSTVTRYEHYNNFPFPSTDNGRKFDNPVKKTIQIDPFNQKTVTEFAAVYDTSYVYPGAGFGPGYTLQNFQKVFFYLTNQPTNIVKYVSESDTLYKETNIYIDTNFDARGYLRQHVIKRIHDKNALNNYMEYVSNYCRGDTTGKHLFGNNMHNVPGKEGNLQYTIDANGNYTRYYYHPISANEFITGTSTPDDYEGVVGEEMDGPNPPPQVSYYKVYDNNTHTLNNSYWQDRRLPVRVDKYVSGTKYNSTYTSYNLSGLPTRTFDDNKFVTAFEFDNIDRLRTGTLPFDFNNTTSYDSIAYDTTFWYSDTLITPTSIGYYDVSTNERESSSGCGGDWYRYCNMAVQFDEGNYIQHFRPYILYNSNFLNQFDTVHTASFIFYPLLFSTTMNGIELNVHAITSNSSSVMLSGPVSVPDLVAPSSNPYCGTSGAFLNYINQQYNAVDVKSIVNNYLGSPSNFKGITFSYSLPPEQPEPPADHNLTFLLSECVVSHYPSECGVWASYYNPRIRIQGIKRKVSQRIIKVYQKATLRYVYDDPNNKVSTYSKIDGVGHDARQIRTDNLFDGFYRVTEKRKFFSSTGYNSSYNQFNYLDKPHSTTDFSSNQTKMFYNKYMSSSKTVNPDSSFSLLDESFQNGLTYTFGTVTGPVNKQVLFDETNRRIEKFTDAVGNLRREVKFAENSADSLITDYRYDSLYRVTEVRTPANKRIHYHFDGYGRVKAKQTPDAGTSQYGYDKNGNMTFSRDANQVNSASNVYTFRKFDGMNRLTGLGISDSSGSQPEWDSLNFETEFSNVGDNPTNPYVNFLLINVYDTLIASDYTFMTPPSGYTSTLNNTKGRVVVTAYRTLKTDDWSYKWYKYDARGRVVKMWNAIDGFDTKITEYTYNSGDVPVITTYQAGESDFRKFRNGYDIQGRLAHVDYWDPNETHDPEEPEGDNPASQWINLTEFSYNANSQIENQVFNTSYGDMEFLYSYNSRNWITSYDQIQSGDDPGEPEDVFHYNLYYEPNGNINAQSISGKYNQSLGNTDNLGFYYSYDSCNRLMFVDNPLGDGFDLATTYDLDGNILTLERKDDEGNVDDDFDYLYYSGTNRLSKVSGGSPQFTYDYNGNMISDVLNDNDIIEYDHRNLITSITRVMPTEPTFTQVTIYKYDDAGNRIRKAVFTTSEPDPEPIGGGIDSPPGDWDLVRNEFYVSGVDGSVIAEYNSAELEHHNLNAGAENFGKIDINGTVNYYLKDHLGSIRVVIDMNRAVVSAQDFDAWGYMMEDRQYEPTLSEYKFTGKERDNESNYDYFGARYYDSRIARWGSIDPLFEKHYDWTPYNYVLNNPIILIDPDGRQEYFLAGESTHEMDYKHINETNEKAVERGYYKYCSRDMNTGAVDSPFLQPLEILETIASFGGYAGVKAGTKIGIILGVKLGKSIADDILESSAKASAKRVDDFLKTLPEPYDVGKHGEDLISIKGNVDEIMTMLTKNSEELPSGAFKLKDGTYINKHISNETGLPTITINRGTGKGIEYKVRVEDK